MKIYFVKAGDTLSAIAGKHGVTVEELLAANPIIADPDDLKVAMKLVIPDKKGEAHAGGAAGKAGQQPLPDKAGQVPMPGKAMPQPAPVHAGHQPSADCLPFPVLSDQPPAGTVSGGTVPPGMQPAVHQDGMKGKAEGGEKPDAAHGPEMPKLPPLPEYAAFKPLPAPCKTCLQKGAKPAPLPLPHAWPPAGAGVQHPFAAVPLPASPVHGLAGPLAPHGKSHGTPGAGYGSGAWPGSGQPGAGPWGGPWTGGSQTGIGPWGGPWSGVGQPGVGPGSGAWPGSGQTGIGPFGGGWPGNGPHGAGPWGSPWAGNGFPGAWTGFHAPYNTPFSVNPYAAKPDAKPPAGGAPDGWRPHDMPGEGAAAFLPPHAMPAGTGGDGAAQLHRAADPGGNGTRGRAPSAPSGRKKPSGKKRKPPAEMTLKDKVMRLQRNHRRS